MFSHLDDPRPPTPGPALSERLVAEGRRRRRVRARAGAATVAVAVLAIGVGALRPRGGGDDQNVVANDGTSTTTVPGDTTSTTVADSADGELETVRVPGDWPAGAVFAGITLDGDVVLGDPATGEVLLTLLEANPLAPVVDVSLNDARDAVYVGTYLAERGGPLLRLQPGQPVAILGTAEAVGVSPDGTRLATIAGQGYSTDEVRVLDASTGAVQSTSSLAELTGEGELFARDVAWDAAGRRLLVEAGRPEAGSELYLVDPGESATRVGPPPGRTPGTGWSLGGPVAEGTALVAETCCALDANSYEGDSALLVVDLTTGAEVQRDPFTGGHPEVAIEADGERLILVGCCGSPDARLLDGDAQPLGGPVYLAIDW